MSNMLSKACSIMEGSPTFPQSCGRRFLPTDTSTLGCLSKTITHEPLDIVTSLILEMELKSPWVAHQVVKERWQPRGNGFMHGGNIGMQFSGHTPIIQKNYRNTMTTSSAISTATPKQHSPLSLTDLPANSSMGTPIYHLLTSTNSIPFSSKSSYPGEQEATETEGMLVENKGHLLGEGDKTFRDCIVDRGRNITEALTTSQSAKNSTRLRVVAEQNIG